MVVGVVIARERCVVMGLLVLEVVAEDVVHAGVSGDETGMEEGDVEEGDTVEEVDVGMCAWVCVFRIVQCGGVLYMHVCILSAAVCTANGLPRLKIRCVDLWVVIVWAYSCCRDGVGFGIASLSLTFGVADFCGCLYCGGFRAVGHNACSGIPRPQRYVGSLLHSAKRDLPPRL
ncbi:hypothetical protein NDU88_003346 [Pleurodeles waltl]|uniref:Uncharacterized protein n=1 Tax=Pleurodeles waltl TaxID=8319 RepID=A0AAV7Q8Q7_PLEWA|nr:hypothetical protein NDU88_003346 [Pleurodeles waltl]